MKIATVQLSATPLGSKLHSKPVMFIWNLDSALEKHLSRRLNFKRQRLLGRNSETVRHVQYCIRLLINVGGQRKDFEVL